MHGLGAKGGAVAECSQALLSGEKINENKKDPGFAPRPGQTLKKEDLAPTSNL